MSLADALENGDRLLDEGGIRGEVGHDTGCTSRVAHGYRCDCGLSEELGQLALKLHQLTERYGWR